MLKGQAVRMAAMSALVAVVLCLSASASSAMTMRNRMLSVGKSGWSTNSDLVKWGKSGWREAVMAGKQAAITLAKMRMMS